MIKKLGLLILLAFLSCGLIYSQNGDQPNNDPNIGCFDGKSCHGNKENSYYVDYDAYKQAAHGKMKCIECHNISVNDYPHSDEGVKYPHYLDKTCEDCHKKQADRFKNDVHSKLSLDLKKDGEKYTRTSNCIVCHGYHYAKSAYDKTSSTFKGNIAKTCGTENCHHDGQVNAFSKSVHGKALARGIMDANGAPSCIDCHFPHEMENPGAVDSRYRDYKFALRLCARCHDDEMLAKKNPNVKLGYVKSYEESIHGSAFSLGDKRMPRCWDCHGAHLILNSKDPKSSVNAGNLKNTCGKSSCHPKYGAGYAIGPMHALELKDFNGAGSAFAGVKYVSIFVTEIVCIFFTVLVCLYLLRKFYQRYHELKRRNAPRIFWQVRFQHFLLFVSFTVLVISGFVLVLPDSWKISFLEYPLTSPILKYQADTHRYAAAVFIGVILMHLITMFSREGRAELRRIFPNFTCFKNLFAMLGYVLFIKSAPPRMDGYSFIEAFEYWLVIIFCWLLAITGVVCWLWPIWNTGISKFAYDICLYLHLYGSIFATLIMVLLHVERWTAKSCHTCIRKKENAMM